MKLKTIKKEGWKLTDDDGKIYLSYLPDILSIKGACYLVNHQVYDRVLNSDINLKQLIEEFDIFNKFKKMYNLEKPKKFPPKVNTTNKYYGHSFIATQEGNQYFLEYLLSRQGGGSRKVPINKEIYESARTGNFSSTDLFMKYNLYHLDISKYDVKE